MSAETPIVGQASEWACRADWLESEARAHHRDPAARARLLLAASEARALAGARDDARRLAVQAASQNAAPAFASRQARALQQQHGDFTAALKHLAKEAQDAKAPAARAHAQIVTAEILRLLQRDGAAASAALVAAEQSDPTDYRAPLQRLAAQLAESQKPPDICMPADDPAKALRVAAGQLRQLRGAEAPRVGPDDGNPALPLLEAQRALARGRISEAADAIERVQARGELRGAVAWLSTLWRVSTATRPEEALLLLRDLTRSNPGRHERRALAARALGAGHRQMLAEALRDDPTDPAYPAFSSLERASLTALMADAPDLSELSRGPVEELAHRPFTSAVERLNAAHANAPALASSPTAATPAELEFMLGRAAARMQAFSELELGQAPAAAGPAALLLDLEQRREAKDLPGLAQALPRVMTQLTAQAEASFISAVLSERAGELAAARSHYEAAMSSSVTRDAAARAGDPEAREEAALFRALSAHTDDPARRSILLTEALFRLDAAAPEFDALAEEAGQSCPELPFAHQLAELSARMRGDRARVARWLSRQRQRARGAGDLRLTSLREALFLTPTEPVAAAERLREAAVAAAPDLALWHCLERVEALDPGARAEYRRRVAPLLGPRGREHLLADAVALYEQAGDASSAVATARELGGELGAFWLECLATEPDDLEWLHARWQQLAQQTHDPSLLDDLYERLSRLELRRGDRDRARSWQRERLKIAPGSLDALRWLEIDSSEQAREAGLEGIAAELFERLGEPDNLGYGFIAARLSIDRGAFEAARPIVTRINSLPAPPLWALRLGVVYAREQGDDRTLLANYRTLRERASHPLDAATLSLRASEAAARLGETGLARDEIQRGLALAPDNPVLLCARPEVLRSNADYAEAAEAYESLAAATQSSARRLEALYQAALLWLDTLGNRARGMLALQEAAAIDSPHAGLLARLRQLHEQSEDFEGLGELIERQRRQHAEPSASAQLELARALALSRTGHGEEARAVLCAFLSRQPLHTEALNALAELHLAAGEWAAAERAWRRLIDAGARDEYRPSALRGLLHLYEGELADLSRAAEIYAELLRDDATDLALRRRLIQALASLGRSDEAIAEQRELLLRAPDDAERCQSLIELVELLTESPSGRREAEALLERAHRTWPEDTRVLEAELNHYRHTGQQGTVRVLTERATNGARNAIIAGRLEPGLFQMLEAAARWGGDPDTAWAARSARGALLAEPVGMGGAGALAGRPELDDLTAPAPLSSAFRRLLYTAGDAIERAYSLDPRSLDALPAGEPIASEVRRWAVAFGVEDVRVLVSAQVGSDCLCVPASPLHIVLGERLLESGNPAIREFLVLRAIKIARANACALTRLAPLEVWPVIAGFLACFAEPAHADGVDAQRLIAARNKIRPHITASPDSDLMALTSAVAAHVLPQAAGIGEAIQTWAGRVALLAVGELSLAVESLWVATSPGAAMPREADARIRWIASNSLARDLVGYAVSEAYIEARKRAGLTSAPD